MLLSSVLLSLGSVALTNALSSLTISGSKFFQDGNQFYIKGMSSLVLQCIHQWKIVGKIASGKRKNTANCRSCNTGISYQLTPQDPLIDTTQCSLDAAMMKTLGANMIRVYHVDPSANHDGCMKAFADNGIYTIIDLDTVRTNLLPVFKLIQQY